MTNPYASLPDHRFWRRAVARVEPFLLDPVLETGFRIAPADKVATAGSCFAQHMSRALQEVGFNYYVAERPDEGTSEVEARRRNFGVFSTRTGNIYTTRQLLQLFHEAFGRRTPAEAVWRRDDSRFVDAFRPRIEPDGFATPEDVRAQRDAHLAIVRRMFETLDVFVFTLGLTEAWRSRIDGSVYPLAPGVAAGSHDPARHEFVNFSVDEARADLATFVRELRDVNRGCRIVLTVSPVPLIATYELRHVLVSTTYSKAVLRVAAEETVRQFCDVDYFPAYEIVTGNHARGAYYEDDLREVNAQGVADVMRVFLRHYAEIAEAPSPAAESLPSETAPLDTSADASSDSLDDIVCDEESIEQARS
jgi:hypothetical protein